MAEVVERRIAAVVAQSGQGIGFRDLQRELGEVEPKLVSDALRTLMESRKVTIHQVDGERIISAVNNLTECLAVVFDLVRASGSEGIDQTAICAKAKLSKSEVTKSLNQLLAQQRIKDMRCFTNKAKKVYLLYELEPSEAVTGGALYNEFRDIDVPFVDLLRSKVVAALSARKLLSVAQVAQLLEAEAGGLNKVLSAKEMRQIVGTLQLDGVISTVEGSGGPFYLLGHGGDVTRNSVPFTLASAVTNCPCVGCPLLDRCSPHGVGAISPSSCTYLQEWLSLSS